jgi:hypothetical protein
VVYRRLALADRRTATERTRASDAPAAGAAGATHPD